MSESKDIQEDRKFTTSGNLTDASLEPKNYTFMEAVKWELYEEPENAPESPSLESRVDALETQFNELESKIERRLRDEMSSSFRHIYNKFIKSTQESGCQKVPEEPKTYTFMEAVKMAKEGKMMTRKEWPKGSFMVYEYEPFYRSVLISSDESRSFEITIRDAEATDWVIVDEE